MLSFDINKFPGPDGITVLENNFCDVLTTKVLFTHILVEATTDNYLFTEFILLRDKCTGNIKKCPNFNKGGEKSTF